MLPRPVSLDQLIAWGKQRMGLQDLAKIQVFAANGEKPMSNQPFFIRW
jgi:hypothetical protein